ncbi:MAG: glycosyltransferase family 2 protein [Candidatus Nealsonbacteria bacterium]
MLYLSVVIPTKDREQDLVGCIESIIGQTVLPNEIIIIDDGNISELQKQHIQSLLYNLNIRFKYFKKNVPGLAESKNFGTKKASSDIVLFLDDDVILEKDYIALLKKEWEKYKDDPNLGGIGGIIENLRPIFFFEKIFNKIFLLSSPISWDITDIGFQVWDPSIKKSGKVFYLSGGVSSFRKDLIEKIPFRPLSPGRTALEDVDFFMKAKKAGYYFLIIPEAKVFHKESSVSKDTDFIIGEKEGFNRCVIYRDNVQKNFKNRMKFIWSSIGWILRQFLVGHFSKGFGMIKGVFKK